MIKCPKCGHNAAQVDTMQAVRVRLCRSSVEKCDEFDIEFDRYDAAVCEDCGHHATLEDFEREAEADYDD